MCDSYLILKRGAPALRYMYNMSAQNRAVRSRKTWRHKQPRGQKNLRGPRKRGAPGTCPKCPPPLIRHCMQPGYILRWRISLNLCSVTSFYWVSYLSFNYYIITVTIIKFSFEKRIKVNVSDLVPRARTRESCIFRNGSSWLCSIWLGFINTVVILPK